MSQFSLWLYPLILSALLASFFMVRHGIKWTWGSLIQQLMILSAASMGFITGDYATWAIVGWILFVLFNLGARTLQNRALSDLTMLRTKSAISKSKLARLLIWGPVGLFNLEMAQAVDAIVHGDNQTATRIITKWEASGLPRQAKNSLHGYVMLGRVIQRDYAAIVAEYEQIQGEDPGHHDGKKKIDRMPFDVFTAAARAYMELGMFEQALEALEHHDIASFRTHRVTLNSLFLAYFALLGATAETRDVSELISKGRHALPEYSRLFWMGRCHIRSGEPALALADFQKALPLVPPNNNAWKSRIQDFIHMLQVQLSTPPATDVPPPDVVPAAANVLSAVGKEVTAEYTPRLRYVLDRAKYVSDLVAPAYTGFGTRALIVSLIVVFILGNLWQVFPEPNTYALAKLTMEGPLSTPDVLAGQYWRIVTYMFLHANVSHLAMNVLGLVWFGKIVERLYGTRGFLLLYFASGILSAFAHLVSSPVEAAVGASGAIMGIFGAGAAAMLRLRGVIPSNIRRTELIWLFSLAGVQVVFDQVINLFAQSTDSDGAHSMPRVASLVHLGGMVSGFLLGLVVPLQSVDRRYSETSLDVNRSKGS